MKCTRWGSAESYSEMLLNIFSPKWRKAFSQFNRYVCENRNCIPVIEKHALEMISTTEKQRVVYLFDRFQFDPTMLEDGTIYFLNLDQIRSMRITHSGESLLDELKGKKYETGDLQGSFYLIQTSA